MSSSGLIYAVIVGAWAAYLVPMWLRRQDELNDARPTERFSTAIRLLSGRAAMERRYTKERGEAGGLSTESATGDDDPGQPDEQSGAYDAERPYEAADVRSFADPVTEVQPAPDPPERPESPERGADASSPAAADGAQEDSEDAEERSTAGRRPTLETPADRRRSAAATVAGKRAKVLARRRRTTMVLFLWFTGGSVLAAVGGLRFLWAPALPAALLSVYIAYLRAQERRRFAVRLDRRRAEDAAGRLRERRRAQAAEPAAEEPAAPVLSENRRAVVEQTDHAEWVDQQRERRRGPQAADSWDPVPVPLPTYVNAPVAPRGAQHVDPAAQDSWSPARSTTAGPTEPPAAVRKPRRTPLFDQHAADDRPRAAGE